MGFNPRHPENGGMKWLVEQTYWITKVISHRSKHLGLACFKGLTSHKPGASWSESRFEIVKVGFSYDFGELF